MTAAAVHPADFAALGTAFLWSFSALAWGVAGRRVGSVPVTAIRILLAGVILAMIHWAVFGAPFPLNIEGESLALLIGSGLAGAFVADLMLFRGLVLIGPRQGMLIQSLGPILTTGFALAWMGEMPGVQARIGIVLTVAGVAWVLAEQKGRQAWKSSPRQFALGVALCLGAVVVVSGAYVLSKMGLVAGPRHFTSGPPLHGVNPFSGTLVRVAAAAVATWLALPLLGRTRATLAALGDRRAMLITIGGTLVGPVMGIWLSMIALKDTKAGVAIALVNTTPLMMIPLVYFAYGERASIRTLLGTLLAVGGVFLLMLR